MKNVGLRKIKEQDIVKIGTWFIGKQKIKYLPVENINRYIRACNFL